MEDYMKLDNYTYGFRCDLCRHYQGSSFSSKNRDCVLGVTTIGGARVWLKGKCDGMGRVTIAGTSPTTRIFPKKYIRVIDCVSPCSKKIVADAAYCWRCTTGKSIKSEAGGWRSSSYKACMGATVTTREYYSGIGDRAPKYHKMYVGMDIKTTTLKRMDEDDLRVWVPPVAPAVVDGESAAAAPAAGSGVVCT